MPEKRGVDWPRLAAMVVCVGAALLLFWLFMTYALGILLPFLLAWVLSLVIRPLVRWVTAHTKLPRGPVAAVLVLLLTGLAVWALTLGVQRAVSELEKFIIRFSESSGDVPAGGDVRSLFSQVMDWVNSLSEHLPIMRHFEEHPGFASFCAWLDASVQAAVMRLVERISASLSAAAVQLVRSLPSMLVFLVVLLLSCYYFSADDGRLRAGMMSLLPPRSRAWCQARWPAWRTRLSRFSRHYLRAYLLLGLITFVEMFAGLSIIGVPYAFLFAILIAVVDFLPVFGTGTVLIPWAVIRFITQDTRGGLGLLILYGVSVIVREVAEPRLLGASLGIHPLLSLASMYAGLQLFGLPGMILSPLFAVAIKGALSRGEEPEETSGGKGEHEEHGGSKSKRAQHGKKVEIDEGSDMPETDTSGADTAERDMSASDRSASDR